ncbi:MAG: fibronectin type III domain-containing protein [Microgenomates group bacterium]|jgi:hypothetical protein
MKKIITIILFILFFGLSAPSVLAADLNVECNGSGSCSKSGMDPLFSESSDGSWVPGVNLIKTINLKNSSSETKQIAVKAARTSEADILENVMLVDVAPLGGVNIFSGNLADFYDLDHINLGNLAPGENKDINFLVTMSPLAGNEYQGRKTVFDLTLGFWATETTTSGGGDVAGTSTGTGGPSVCTDSKPGTPINLAVIVGPNSDQVTLFWSGVSPYTSFLIAYSDTPDAPKWGNPDVGNVSSYIVSGLPNGTFFFWVRENNSCMPGDFAGPVSVFLSSSSATGLAGGFQENVLGINSDKESTPSGKLSEGTQSGEVAGIETGICQSCLWWPILLLEFIALLTFYHLVLKKYGSKNNYFISTLIPLSVYLVFQSLNKSCVSSIFFCRYFWLLDGGLFLVFMVLIKGWKDLTNSSK